MPSQNDHADSMIRRLPSGEAWPDNTDGTWEFDYLIRGLSGEPANVDADAEALAENFFPDTSVDFLTDWERLLGLSRGSLSDADRRAQIIAKLRSQGYIDRASIESALQTYRGDVDLNLLHNLYSRFRAGDSAGKACLSKQWEATWTCEYMTNVLGIAPDAFGSWTTSRGTVTNNAAWSPITESNTAATLTYTPGTSGTITQRAFTAANGTDMHTSLWIRSSTAGQPRLEARLLDRAGATVDSLIFNLGSYWSRIVLRGNAGTGGSSPILRLTMATAQTLALQLSYAVAGVRDLAFEAYAATLPPLNTTGEFAVIGENG